MIYINLQDINSDKSLKIFARVSLCDFRMTFLIIANLALQAQVERGGDWRELGECWQGGGEQQVRDDPTTRLTELEEDEE